MERRKYLRARRRATILALLRLLALAMLLVSAYFGVSYISQRSAQEVAAVKEREESPWYLVVEPPGDKEIRMTVVNDDGEMSMEISGDEVRLSRDQRTAIFIGAEATYYEEGEWSLKMKAGRIEYDTQTEDFLLSADERELSVRTKDGMSVRADEVEWRRNLTGNKAPSFRFAKGVKVVTRDGNSISANYMQADREILYMELVGEVHGELVELRDTEFVEERELADIEALNLEDFESLAFEAEEVIYDKRNKTVLATCRNYDRYFKIIDMDGQEVEIAKYQEAPSRVTFSKKEITIACNHLEAKIEQKWAVCKGGIRMVVPPAEPKPDDDRALQVTKRFETRIATEEVEYFWGRDYILTHAPTRVAQEDRLALADRIVYWGDEKLVLLDGNLTIVQGSGSWMLEEELIEVDDHDIERIVRSYTELLGDRAVVYLNNNDFIASGNVLTRQDERETAADTIVYQDDIKRITAQGNVKFKDKDGQTFMCSALVYHNDSDFLEVSGGATGTIRLPAKYANDINRALAETREEPVPAEIEDPLISEEPPTRNPNTGVYLARDVQPLSPATLSEPLMPLPIPGEGTPAGEEVTAAEELVLHVGEEGIELVGPPVPEDSQEGEA